MPKTISLKSQLLHWAQHYQYVAYLDSCNYQFDKYNTYDCLVAVANKATIKLTNKDLLKYDAFDLLKQKINETSSWWFGCFSYDLKNQIEKLYSKNDDTLEMLELFFFQPEILFLQKNGKWSVEILNKQLKLSSLIKQLKLYKPIIPKKKNKPLVIKNRVNEKSYNKIFQKIHQDIVAGTYYELNFCRAFYAEDAVIDPVQIFKKLMQQTEAPMSGFVKMQSNYILSASPERFLKKQGKQLIAQPMKGTCKRSINKQEDEQLKTQLQQSIKERAENIMIVDLMRNDLTKSAQLGSIAVEDLFHISSFKGFHTMISTIKAMIKADVHLVDAIKNAFPIGSMTGAPKVKVMEYIERYEQSKRGLYAGALGYITPNGNFDFSVLIRTMLYNAKRQYLSFQTGGAIVYDSIAEEEFAETNLKAENMLKCLVDD